MLVAALQLSSLATEIQQLRQHVHGFYTFSSKCRESKKLTAYSFDPKYNLFSFHLTFVFFINISRVKQKKFFRFFSISCPTKTFWTQAVFFVYYTKININLFSTSFNTDKITFWMIPRLLFSVQNWQKTWGLGGYRFTWVSMFLDSILSLQS